MQNISTWRFHLRLVYLLKTSIKNLIIGLFLALVTTFATNASANRLEARFAIIVSDKTEIKGSGTFESRVSATAGTSVFADNPLPVLISLSKDCLTQGYNQDLYVTLTGTNFIPGAKVRISRAGIPIGNFDPSSVSADGKTIETVVPAAWLQFFLFFPGSYTIQVVNPAPAVQGGISNSKLFTIYAPIITGSITGNTSVCPGATGVVYSVPPVADASYVWELPTGATIVNSNPGGNQITVNINNATSGEISATAVNGCRDPGTESTLKVTVNNPPVINSISSGVPVCPNGEVTITVDARGANLSYQWFKRRGSASSNGFPLTNGGTVSGSRSATLKISSVVDADAGFYYVVVSNTCNTAGIPSSNSEIKVNTAYTNTIANIQEPVELLVGQPATYTVTPANKSLKWEYTWTILYNTNPATSEIKYTGTNPTLTIPSVRADMTGIIIVQLPPSGIPCVTAIDNVVNLSRTPLPVELIYLIATKKDNNVVEVEWATAMEQNSEGFEVQVSQDAKNYRTLAFVASKAGGNTNQKQVYTFHDKENGKYGTRYYRLMQRDMNGDSEYFGPKAVQIGEATESLSVYPNPFENEINLELNAEEAGTMHVMVTNAIGAKVLEHTLNIQKGSSKQNLKFNSNLPQGMYHITTQMSGKVQHFKLLKQH